MLVLSVGEGKENFDFFFFALFRNRFMHEHLVVGLYISVFRLHFR